MYYYIFGRNFRVLSGLASGGPSRRRRRPGLIIISIFRTLILTSNNSLTAASPNPSEGDKGTKHKTIACKNPIRIPSGIRVGIGLLLSRPYISRMISASNGKRTMSTSSKPVPVKVYLNPDKEKESIVNENKGRTGIYRWVHIESGKSYVGSSVRLNIRFKQYFNYNHISYPKRNMMIYKALLKYGYAEFRLEILEYCDPEV